MTAKPRFSCAIFDLDGTVFDTYRGLSRCLKHAFEKSGLREPSPELIKKFIGPSLHYSFSTFTPLAGDEVIRAIAYYREEYFAGGIYECELYPGTEELLLKLKERGVKLSVASSKPQNSVNLLFERFGLFPLFDRVIGADPGSIDSDKKELILRAAAAPDAVMTGDRIYDVRGAKAAGIKCIGAAYGYGGRRELEENGCDYIVNSPEEIFGIVIGDN